METNLTSLRNQTNMPAPVNNIANATLQAGFETVGGFDLLLRTAKMFAQSTIVPKQFQGNVPNCAIALNMAFRLHADPMQVMQNLYIIYNQPAWSSRFLIATFNQCGRYTSLKYEIAGTPGQDDYRCRAYATEKETGQKVIGPAISIGIAKREGWYGKTGSKWQTMPDLMLRYRAASMLIKTVAPEISMGLQTVEEARDIALSKNEDGVYTVEEIKEAMASTEESATADIPNPQIDADAPDQPAPAHEENAEPSPEPISGKVHKEEVSAKSKMPASSKPLSKKQEEVDTWLANK